MHINQNLPYITVHKIENYSDFYEIRPGKIKRDFLDQTYMSHGYSCPAITAMPLHGWEFILPNDVEIIWNGKIDSSPNHIQILSGENSNSGMPIVHTNTGNGLLTFTLNCIIETDKNHDLLLDGPPNYFIDGAEPVKAIIQSGWYHHNTIHFCWKINKPNQIIKFPKGMPFVFIKNYPKNLLENTSFTIKSATKEHIDKLNKYAEEVANFYKNNENWSWSNMYKNGTDEINEPFKYIEKPFRPMPSKPKNVNNNET